MAAGIWRNNAGSWSRLVRGWDSAPGESASDVSPWAVLAGRRCPWRPGLRWGGFRGRTPRSPNRSLKTVSADDEIRSRIPRLSTRP